jgi:hypothetical protein
MSDQISPMGPNFRDSEKSPDGSQKPRCSKRMRPIADDFGVPAEKTIVSATKGNSDRGTQVGGRLKHGYYWWANGPDQPIEPVRVEVSTAGTKVFWIGRDWPFFFKPGEPFPATWCFRPLTPPEAV